MLNKTRPASAFGAVAAENHLQVRTTGAFPRSSRTVPGVGTVPEATEGAAAVPTLPGVIDRVIESGGNSFFFEATSRPPPPDEERKNEGPPLTIPRPWVGRSEEHTSEIHSHFNISFPLFLEKKKK